MNSSDETSYHEEVLLANSTWGYSYYHQNYTLSPVPDKAGTSKPAACEQVHIAVEVCNMCGGKKLLFVFKLFCAVSRYLFILLSRNLSDSGSLGNARPHTFTLLRSFLSRSSLSVYTLHCCVVFSFCCSGLSDPGYYLPAGEHPGHHSYSEEQEPPLTHVLLCLQVNGCYLTNYQSV